MANYFCTDSVEEQVDYLTDKVKDLKTTKLDKAAVVQETGTGTNVVMSQKAVTDQIDQKSNATNLANGTADVLIQTTDTNHSFKVMSDGRAKVQTAPTENDDVVRKLELDKKLTAPTTPTADSAVTMLADGTVGTKPLSEIGGGGGGKLYRHSLIFIINGYLTKGDIYSSRETPFTFDEIKSNAPDYIFVHFESGGQYIGVLHLTSDLTNSFLMGVEIALTCDTPTNEFKSVVINNLTGIEFPADNVTEV